MNTMTKECIFTALLLLMEQKSYEEITITDIAKKAGVSRMSYYRFFKSKDDILVQYFNEIFERFLEQFKDEDRKDKRQFAIRIFETCREHHVLVESVIHARMYDMVMKCFVNYCTYMVEHVFEMDIHNPETDYLIYSAAGRFCLVIFRWMERGMPESPEEMGALVSRNIF